MINQDSFQSFFMDLISHGIISYRRYAWRFLGIPTIVLKTNVGFNIYKFVKRDRNGLYVIDITGRVSLNVDGTTDKYFARSWDWAIWCADAEMDWIT